MKLALDRCAAALVILAGAAGQIFDAYAAGSIADRFVRLSFGPLLCVAVVMRLWALQRPSPKIRSAAGMAFDGNYRLIRRTSREIYILLFALFALSQLLNIGTSLSVGTPLTHEVSSLYFVCGLCGLMTTRLMAASAPFAVGKAPQDSSASPATSLAALSHTLVKSPNS